MDGDLQENVLHEDIILENLIMDNTEDVQTGEQNSQYNPEMEVEEIEGQDDFDEDVELMQDILDDDVAPELSGQLDIFIDVFAQRDLLDDETSFLE